MNEKETPSPQSHLRGTLLPQQINMAVDGNAVTLSECRPGPFLFNGSLGFKTEYGAMSGKDIGNGKVEWEMVGGPEVYCMDSGEAFWGGVSGREARAALLVNPVELYFQDMPAPATTPVSQVMGSAAREKALRDIKAEAYQREPVPALSSPKDALRGTALALSARLSAIERICRAALEAEGPQQ